MEFLQEPTFTVFFALVLTLLVAKIVSFALSNSVSNVSTAVSSAGEGAVAKEVTLERELVVRGSKGGKRVKFVDDVVIRRIERYEGSENPLLLDDAGGEGDVIVEGKSVDEITGDRVAQFGDDGLGEGSGVDLREIDTLVEGREQEVVGGNVESLVTSEVKNEEDLEVNDMVIDEREGNGDREEAVAGDVMEKGKMRDENGDVIEKENMIDENAADDDDEDDDWEGIERSELEKVFAEAVNYVGYGGKDKEDDQLAKLGSDALMQLYGLHKVAVEGPCHEPQPMALMVSARGKWNAWQRLGSMSPEVAMEQYIQVLSENLPGWMHEYSTEDNIQGEMETKDKLSVAEHERKPEVITTPIGDSSTSQSSVDKVDAV